MHRRRRALAGGAWALPLALLTSCSVAKRAARLPLAILAVPSALVDLSRGADELQRELKMTEGEKEKARADAERDAKIRELMAKNEAERAERARRAAAGEVQKK